MKKLLYISLIATIFVACGKTNKRKLDNNWKVESFIYSSKGETSSNIEETNEHSIIMKDIYSGSTTTKVGVLHDFQFKIDKKGTFEITRSYSFSQNNETKKEEQIYEGNWYFIKENGDYKKKERVQFNFTKITRKKNEKIGDSTMVTTNIMDINDGEFNWTLQVLESSKKKLVLESENNLSKKHTITNFTGTSTSIGNSTYKMKFVLKAK